MRNITAGILCGCLLLCSRFAQAERPLLTETFLSQTFEEELGSWVSIAPTAKVSLTHDKAHIKEGKGALQFDYGVRKGEMNALYFPLEKAPLAKATALKFWLKSDTISIFAVVLEEKGGGHYMAAFTVPKEQWQKVELAPEDFALNNNENDPKDPNGKLDMEQIERIGVIDVAQIFVQGDENLLQLFNIKEGARVFHLDSLMATDEALPKSSVRMGDVLTLDTYVRPQMSWVSVGGLTLNRIEGKPLEGMGVEAKYHQTQGKIGALLKTFPVGTLKDAKQVALTVASQNAIKLVVQVEEKSGGKYSTTIEIKGGSERTDFVLNLADFKVAQDSKDSNDHLDADQIYQIVLIDLTGATESVDRDNTLWLNRLRAIFGK